MSDHRNRMIEPNQHRELLESKKQLLRFDEVNYEQRREQYQERNPMKGNITHQNAPKYTEKRSNP